MTPELLDHFGLEAVVEWQIDKFQSITGINCKRIIDLKDIVVAKHVATTIFSKLQEALTNIMKHAAATIAQVILKKQDGNILLKVQDNVKGIIESQQTKAGSLGLASMQERVRSFGGELMVIRTPGDGTIIAVSIPHDITPETMHVTMNPVKI